MISRLTLPSHLQSIDSNNISSETIAINCALASGMLSDFVGEEYLCATVSGRMGSGKFDFNIKNAKGNLNKISVDNSQIEIDGAFEGLKALSLLEAKMGWSEDFLIRQLYYPFRVWKNKIAKNIKSVFLVYTNGIFSFYEYKFQDYNIYNSLTLIRHKNYSIEDTDISELDIMTVFNETDIIDEPTIPFPQADSFKRVINICELLNIKELNREQVTEEYAFDSRQTNYYTDAARYLGLIEKNTNGQKPTYYLSELGKKIMRLSYKDRQLAFCKRILQHKVFYETGKLLIEKGLIPEKKIIIEIMKKSNLYNIGSDNTFERRSSTITGWINWIFGLRKP